MTCDLNAVIWACRVSTVSHTVHNGKGEQACVVFTETSSFQANLNDVHLQVQIVHAVIN